MVDNPPAFPSQPCGSDGLPTNERDPGMDLRDYFAGQALVSMGLWMPATARPNLNADWTMQVRSEWAYRHADAMLEARKNHPQIGDK